MNAPNVAQEQDRINVVVHIKPQDWSGWIDARVAEAALSDGGLLAKVVTITPDMARWVLDNRHPKNRIPLPSNIKKLAGEMAGGRWALTGEPVKFDKSGQMIDGQHRMLACIQAQVPFRTMVLFGLEASVFDVLDTGAVRKAGDVLSIMGVSHAKDVAAGARLAFALLGGARLYPTRMYGVTNSQIAEFVNRNPSIVESYAFATAVYAALPRARKSAALAMHFVLSTIDRAGADQFFTSLADGTGLRKGDPIYALRDRFIRAKEERLAKSVTWILESYIRAWNAWREGRQLHKIQCDGVIPEIAR